MDDGLGLVVVMIDGEKAGLKCDVMCWFRVSQQG